MTFGLWPFNFRPKNGVSWLKDQNGLRFYGRGIVFTPLPATYPFQPFSVEIDLRAGTEPHSNLPHILSLYDRGDPKTFFIGQWKSHLILAKGVHGKAGYREMGVRDALKKEERRLITVTSGDPRGTRIYVDGTFSKMDPKLHLLSKGDTRLGQIVLGNSPTGNEYWNGDLYGLAIYDYPLLDEEVFQHFQIWQKKETLSLSEGKGLAVFYPFDESHGERVHDRAGGYDLLIPSRFSVLQKKILVPPWQDFRLTRSYITDVITNILGFIPFGFFLSAYILERKPRPSSKLLPLSIPFSRPVSSALPSSSSRSTCPPGAPSSWTSSPTCSAQPSEPCSSKKGKRVKGGAWRY